MALIPGSYTYKEICEHLDSAEKWLLSKNIELSDSRFETVKLNMAKIKDAHEQGKIKELIQDLGWETIIASLTESLPFINIYKAFNTLKDHMIPKDTLKRAIKGPFLSHKEDGAIGTNDGRNLLFELELGAILSLKGANILDFDDISFELERAIFNIQCKRPTKEKSVSVNIDNALDQLKKRFNQYSDQEEPRGIVALSVDKLLGSDQKIIIVQNVQELERHVTNELLKLDRKFSHLWSKILDLRIKAVILFLKYVTEVKDIGRLSGGTQILFSTAQNHPTLQAVDAHRMATLKTMLEP